MQPLRNATPLLPLRNATLHLLTVHEYFASTFEGRTELVEGIVYDVSPQSEPHAFAVQQLTVILLPKLLPLGRVLRTQSPIVVPNWQGRNAPEIDVSVIASKYYTRTPTSADALAFIEVSDTTYNDDRETKIPLYVHASVPAWIVNIARRQVEYYGSAADLASEYGQVTHEGDTFQVLGIDVPVAELFAVGPG